MVLVWVVLALFLVTLIASSIEAIQNGARKRLAARGYEPNGDRLSDIPWGDGKDLSELIALPSLEDAYRNTKMYELEKWWDKEHLPTVEYNKKYSIQEELTTAEKAEIVRRFKEAQHRQSVILPETAVVSFVPTDRYDFARTMIYENKQRQNYYETLKKRKYEQKYGLVEDWWNSAY